jgi:hypothetical protein
MQKKIEIEKLLSGFLLLSLFTTRTILFGAETPTKPQGAPTTRTDFVLTVKDNLISLSEKDASLKEVLEEIGRRMKIDVVGNVAENEKITV